MASIPRMRVRPVARPKASLPPIHSMIAGEWQISLGMGMVSLPNTAARFVMFNARGDISILPLRQDCRAGTQF